MPIIFSPNGLLDVATDPSDLPEQVDGKVATSGSMLRCTNLTLERAGIASTRKGTSKLNTTAISAPNHIVEQGGVRWALSGSIYRNETSIESGLTNYRWTTALYNPYNQVTQTIYAINGTDRKKIEGSNVYGWGIAAPVYAPTVNKGSDYAVATAADQTGLTATNWLFTFLASDGIYSSFAWEEAVAEGADSYFPESYGYVNTFHFEEVAEYGVSGKYEVVYTYARYVDGLLIAESDPSPAGETQIESNLSVTWVAPTDTQITHVRIYRSIANTAGQWLYAGVYAVADLTATIHLRDDELGTQVSTTHDRPPLGSQVLGPSLGGQLYILKDNLLYFCLPQQPEYWPATYYIEVTAPQFPLMAGCFFGGNLMLASEHEIFLVSGSGASSYFAQPMSAVTGTKSKQCFLAVKGTGVFHLGSDGIYLYTAAQDYSITDANLKPIFDGITKGSIPGLNQTNIGNCLMIQHQNKLWFGYPASGETYCKDFLVFDLELKKFSHYQYPWAITCLAIDHLYNRILAGDESGYVRVLDDASITTDDGTAIDYDLQSKEFVQFPKYFPRYARWDVNLVNGASASGEILLNGVVKQTHPITTSRWTKKRLVATCTGTRMSVRVHGSGPVDVYGVEVE